MYRALPVLGKDYAVLPILTTQHQTMAHVCLALNWRPIYLLPKWITDHRDRQVACSTEGYCTAVLWFTDLGI